MPRVLALLAALLTSAAFAADLPTVPGKPVTLSRTATLADISAAVQEQTGLALDVTKADAGKKVTVAFDKVPFWTAVDALATECGCRVSVGGTGRTVALVPLANGVKAQPSSVDGPFRVALKQVNAKRDFETGLTTYQLYLEAHWEPRFPVYLIDNEPKVTAATAAGKPVSAAAPTGRVAATGFTHPLTITLRDVPRSAKQIDEVSGTFAVIAAHRILPVEFADLTDPKAVVKEQDGVTVTLKPVKHGVGRVELNVEMKYPDGHPEMESFEQVWASGNRLRVIPPSGQGGFEPADYNTDSRGNIVYGNYAFAGPNGKPGPLPANLKGWKAIYETPSPLLKQTVRFTLKGIELP